MRTAELVLLLVGCLLAIPYWAFWTSLFNEWFGVARGFSRFGYGLGGLAIMFLCMLAADFGGATVAWTLAALAGRLSPSLSLERKDQIAVSFVFGCAIVILVPLAVYHHKRRRFRRLMDVMTPHCVKCGYPMRGLRVVMGRIRCPECGQTQSAREIVRQFQHARQVYRSSGGRPP